MISNQIGAAFWLRLSGSCLSALGILAIAAPPAAATGQTIINVPPDPAPSNVGADTILNLSDGGVLGDYFSALDGSTVNISGGAVGRCFHARADSTLNISGGTVGHDFIAYYGSTVFVSGGTIGYGFDLDGSTANISGGMFGESFIVNYSTATISGGVFGDGFYTGSGSSVEFSALEFLLDGTPIPGLERVGDSIVLAERGGSILSGTFLNGTPFDFVLNPSYATGQDYFNPNATLRLTVVPEPASVVLLALSGLSLLAVAVRRRS